jgi:hypothetical protein
MLLRISRARARHAQGAIKHRLDVIGYLVIKARMADENRRHLLLRNRSGSI